MPIEKATFLIATLCARFELSDSLLTEAFVVNRVVNRQSERQSQCWGPAFGYPLKLKSSKNSEAGSTPVTSKLSRARVQAT